MRKFSSYGPVQNKQHYYAPRTELINRAKLELMGEYPDEGGHYITVWAPRQTGKSWTMREVIRHVKAEDDFEIGVISLQSAKTVTDEQYVLDVFVNKLRIVFGQDFPKIQSWAELSSLFTSAYFSKPVILIIDEFDALYEEFINRFANEFRDMYLGRIDEVGVPSGEKHCLLHGLALIGVRSVLGIENVTGSPFNVQRSVHIPNLTEDEVTGMFKWYEEESGQKFAPGVIERVYYEMRGQPGLTCWLGELLTETYNRHESKITMNDFESTYSAAVDVLPNNNIVNIVSKAKQAQYKPLVLELYQTTKKISFRYEDPTTNFLYMNGVVDHEKVLVKGGDRYYLKFPNPFIQKRLFNYFAHELYLNLTHLHDPLLDLSNIVTPTHLDIPAVLSLYEEYLHKNRSWLFKSAPRRAADERIYEAVYHFNFYMYLNRFLYSYDSVVLPEFPTGNGQIDLLIYHGSATYGLEVKSYANRAEYDKALVQAAKYAKRLNTPDIWLVLFIEMIDDDNRQKLEKPYVDTENDVTVHPCFVTIGSMK